MELSHWVVLVVAEWHHQHFCSGHFWLGQPNAGDRLVLALFQVRGETQLESLIYPWWASSPVLSWPGLLLWFNPSRQLRTAQLLALPSDGMGERLKSFFIPY